MSTFKTLADPSASNIAEMVIQGNTMGATKSTRHLGDYAGGNREIRNLAERLLHTEEANAMRTGRGICPWAARDVERDTLVRN